jgi:hypothetical protein
MTMGAMTILVDGLEKESVRRRGLIVRTGSASVVTDDLAASSQGEMFPLTNNSGGMMLALIAMGLIWVPVRKVGEALLIGAVSGGLQDISPSAAGTGFGRLVLLAPGYSCRCWFS